MYIKTVSLSWWFHHSGSSNCPGFSLQVQGLWWKWPQLLLAMPGDWRVQRHNGLPFYEERLWILPWSRQIPGLWQPKASYYRSCTYKWRTMEMTNFISNHEIVLFVVWVTKLAVRYGKHGIFLTLHQHKQSSMSQNNQFS